MSHNVALWVGANVVTALVTSLMLVWSLNWAWRTRHLLRQPGLTGTTRGMAQRNLVVALDQATTAALILVVALATLAVAWTRHTQRVADYAANGSAAFALIWARQCAGVWWDRRTLRRLLRLEQRASVHAVEREEWTG